MQAFARRISFAGQDCQQRVYTYSSKRSRTRTPSASATSCKRPTVISRRPFIQLFTVCRLTPIRSANSPSLIFFSTSLCAGSTATQTSFLFSFDLIVLLVYTQNGPLAACHRRGPAIIGLGDTRPSHNHVYSCQIGILFTAVVSYIKADRPIRLLSPHLLYAARKGCSNTAQTS